MPGGEWLDSNTTSVQFLSPLSLIACQLLPNATTLTYWTASWIPPNHFKILRERRAAAKKSRAEDVR